MPDHQTPSFSPVVGLLYVFNLIVGTGALALPKAFQTAGFLLSTLLLLGSAFASYLCATFVIESMAIANSLLRHRHLNRISDEDQSVQVRELSFDITTKVEVGEMAYMFLGRRGVFFSYFALTIYLLGDMAIYSAAVPKSLMNIICSSSLNASMLGGQGPCQHSEGWPHFLTRLSVYRLCILVFISFCLPMVLAGMTKTKLLQLSTTLSRWLAFLLMVILASVQLLQDGPKASPPAVNLKGFGSLFGVAVYAFMCHHSIPGLVTPMRNKSYLNYKLLYVYGLVLLFYCTLSLTGAFAFHTVMDVYTLNFLHDEQTGGLLLALCDYFLALFPVFTLTSSYIIVAITLSNNVRVLARMLGAGEQRSTAPQRTEEGEEEALLEDDFEDERVMPLQPQSSRSLVRRDAIIPVIVVVFPALVALFTDDVLLLASITGSTPGVAVQFVVPSLLVIWGRKQLKATVGEMSMRSESSSPLQHHAWPYVAIGWAVFALVVAVGNLLFHLA